MHIFKSNDKVIVKHSDLLYSSPGWNWDSFINREGLHNAVLKDIENLSDNPGLSADLENPGAPIGNQEIWASGVTYLRSMDARMEESKDAGGGDFYAKGLQCRTPRNIF
jgi:2-dehydro-3-deoxy-D-arabinonate dehydratase